MKNTQFPDISKLPEGTRALIEKLRIGTYVQEPSLKIMSLMHRDMPLDLLILLDTMSHVSNASVNIGDWYIESRSVTSSYRILVPVDFDDDKETAVVIGTNLGTMVLVAAWDADEKQASVFAIDKDFCIASCIGSLNEFALPLIKKKPKAFK